MVLAKRSWFCATLLLLVAAGQPLAGRGSAAAAAEKKAFQEARFEKGQLKYVHHLPVLSVEGTPAEMGRQEAALTGKVVKTLAPYPRQLMTLSGHGKQWDQCVETAQTLTSHAPPAYRDELRSYATKAAIPLDLLQVANTIMDLHRGGFACSSLLVEPAKSKTGSILFGRNLDFFTTLGVLDRYGLVTVYRPQGKHAFATVGFPGVIGCLSGMNDAGLAIAVHEVRATADWAPMLNPKAMPYAFCLRRILEDCTTIEQAEKLLRSTERSTILSVAICDRAERRRPGNHAEDGRPPPRQRRHLREHEPLPHRRLAPLDGMSAVCDSFQSDGNGQTRRGRHFQEARRSAAGCQDAAVHDLRAGPAYPARGDGQDSGDERPAGNAGAEAAVYQMILLIDNYDSFTYNLVQRLGEIDPALELEVHRNDQISLDEIEAKRPSHLIISPGPCTPDEAGISVPCVTRFAGKIPLLGVCLGHQSIGRAYGGKIVRAGRLMHGKTDMIQHNGEGLYEGLPNPFEATRYHSLVIQPDTLSEDFVMTAWSRAPDGTLEIMGIQHKTWPLYGVQYHPESFLTSCGTRILEKFLAVG